MKFNNRQEDFEAGFKQGVKFTENIGKFSKKCKHQWDYIGTGREGDMKIMCENPIMATWICPYCDEVKKLVVEE